MFECVKPVLLLCHVLPPYRRVGCRVMNSYNRKVINPLIRKIFQRDDVGRAVFGVLTVGTLGLAATRAYSAVKNAEHNEYEEARRRLQYTGGGTMERSVKDKRLRGVAHGFLVAFPFTMATRQLSRRYLRYHSCGSLRELLHVTDKAYATGAALSIVAVSFVSSVLTARYYSWYPEKHDTLAAYGIRERLSGASPSGEIVPPPPEIKE